MNDVERLLGETLASGELDRFLHGQYRRWRQLCDFGEFREAILARAWEHRDQLRGNTVGEFLAWLRRLAWSVGVERWRYGQRQEGLLRRLFPFLPRWAPSGEERVDTKDFVDWLLAGLSARERKLLVLKYYRNYPTAQLAGALSCTEAAAHQLHYRALGKLRQRLKKLGNDR